MSKRKKKVHNPRTQPWWGKTKSAPVAAKIMERKIQGAMGRQHPPEQQWFTLGHPPHLYSKSTPYDPPKSP